MVDQEKIHNQCLSDNPKKRIHALEELKIFFSSMPDKQQAFNDLHGLANDEYNSVRFRAAEALGLSYPHVLDKQQAVNDLIKLTNDKDSSVRSSAAYALGSAYSQVPDKHKRQAWNDLIKLTNDEYSYVRSSAAYALGLSYPHVLDKQQAWNELHILTNDEYWGVRSSASKVLGYVFSHVPDKKQVWSDLHRLTSDEKSLVRFSAASSLGDIFSEVSDKKQAWNDLIKLTNDEDRFVRSSAAYALGLSYPHVSDKQQAWNDLIKLTNDKRSDVRSNAIEALGLSYPHVLDKQQVWNEFHRLINDESWNVRSSAAYALGSAYSQVPDKHKQQAWNDLIKLTNDEYSYVRSWAAYALGSAFSQVPDKHKQQAFNNLIRLTNDEYSYVRTSSNHSLGRVLIFMASQAETKENYKKELEKAIEFFETAAKEASYFNRVLFWETSYSNPAQFCLPFYRSLYTIIFKQQKAKEEVNKYLEEAKSAIKDSESKKQLFEAVENLAEALTEVQNIGNIDLSGMKDELNFYRKYCDHAIELMKCTDEKAPFATKVLRKGLPILDKNLKELFEEIQKKAKVACKESKGTATEEIACTVNKEIQKWEIGNQEEMTQKVEDIAYLLKMKIADLPENRYLLNKIEAMKNERNLAKQYDALLFVIGQIPTMKVISEQELDQKLQKFDRIFDEIICVKDKLNCISFDISQIKLNSANVISDLKTMKEELEKLSKIEGLNTLSIEKLDSIQAEKINGFNNNILGRLDEIKILIHELSKDNNEICEEYSRRLDELKQSKLDTLLQRYSAVISLIGFVISGISIAH